MHKADFTILVETNPAKAKEIILRFRRRGYTKERIAREIGVASSATLTRLYHKLDLIKEPLQLTPEDLDVPARDLSRKYKVSAAHIRRKKKRARGQGPGSNSLVDGDY